MADVVIEPGASVAFASGNTYWVRSNGYGSVSLQVTASSSLALKAVASSNQVALSDIPQAQNGVLDTPGATLTLAANDIVDALPGNLPWTGFVVSGGSGTVFPVVGYGVKQLT